MKITNGLVRKLTYVLIALVIIVGFKTVNYRNNKITLMRQENKALLAELNMLRLHNYELENIIERNLERLEKLTDEIENLRKIRARVTAYSPSDNKSNICADENPEITATGTTPRIGVVAADPNKLPYGTKLYIPGYGYGVVEDTGGFLRRSDGLLIDIFLNSYKEAINWGVREIDIEIQGGAK